jgi:DNA-binding transcriptional LysR family regulator
VNPALLEFFRNAYSSLVPNCPIHLSGGNSSHILQRLEQENLDAALLPMPVEGLDWVTQELARDPLVVCMRTDDALARAPEVSEVRSFVMVSEPSCSVGPQRAVLDIFGPGPTSFLSKPQARESRCE